MRPGAGGASRDAGGARVRVVVAPDSFKGTFAASAVAAHLAAGLREAGFEAVELPLADGGEGTTAALRAVLGGTLHSVEVEDPLGRPVRGQFLISADGRTAVVETASASGLGLVAPEERDAWRASTRGTGQLLVAAAQAAPERILLGVGGSATTDGGQGALEVIADGGGLGRAHLVVLCDVVTPFEEAPAVFGPQKGADEQTVERLERRLDALAQTFRRDPRGRARSGAAGGLSGGLWAQLGAELRPGIESVLEAVGFEAVLEGAAAVVTGEGRLDDQTSAGKVVAGVIAACRVPHPPVPVHAVVGQTQLDDDVAAAMGLASVTIASGEDDLKNAGRHLADEIGSIPTTPDP